jgi:RNA polymerase sigma-70 factor (ECF subfamily)
MRARYMIEGMSGSFQGEESDEGLAGRLARRDRDALSPLYRRYAPLIYHIASQSLDPGSAEDIVQEVFLALWSKAGSFDERRGPFRPWLLQIAHFRILNELRRKSRRPLLDPDFDMDLLDGLPYKGDGPAEETWREFRAQAVRSAIETLPSAQRQALSLAFFDDLTQDQVAEALRIPHGTAKTRIRSALARLRRYLAPAGAILVLIAVLTGLLMRSETRGGIEPREERALELVTASDITTLHLAPTPGIGTATHGSYRGRSGTGLAVMALHDFSSPPAGKTYAAWVRVRGDWILLGTALPDRAGNALLIGERPELTALPQDIEVRLEVAPPGTIPGGETIVEWHERKPLERKE